MRGGRGGRGAIPNPSHGNSYSIFVYVWVETPPLPSLPSLFPLLSDDSPALDLARGPADRLEHLSPNYPPTLSLEHLSEPG